MEKYVPYSGFCPVQGKNCEVRVTYVENSPLDHSRFEKGTCDCAFQDNGCSINCPIAANAPDIIH